MRASQAARPCSVPEARDDSIAAGNGLRENRRVINLHFVLTSGNRRPFGLYDTAGISHGTCITVNMPMGDRICKGIPRV